MKPWIAVVAALSGCHALFGVREVPPGRHYCWGGNEQGQLPDGTSWTSTPMVVP